jgi:tetratricopeptide (TPR) repeat protein
MAVFLALCLAVQSDEIANLRDVSAVVRRNACSTLGEKRVVSAIRPLIELLARETDNDVRAAALGALQNLTGKKDLPAEAAAWNEWWEKTGKTIVGLSGVSEERMARDFNAAMEKTEQRAKEAKNEIRILSITVAIIAISFVMVMLYFVGHVASKLKEWKEVVKQAGVYLEESQQITKRTDRVLEELEAKKLDILEFVKKLKEEKEAEIERYGDLLQQNTEHKLREEVMALRQKAEKELEETMGNLRSQVEMELRRMGGDQREKGEKDFKAQNERFLREVEAHTLYLQAGFSHSQGKLEAALKTYRTLVALKPDHQVAWRQMGTAYRELMRLDEAVEAYMKAAELLPTDSATHYQLAGTYARQRLRDKMLAALKIALQCDPELKDEALNDPAFRDYWSDPAFKDLAEA